MKKIIFTITILFFLIFCCNVENAHEPSGPDGWLKGNTAEKFETIAAQLRGFDVAMVEVG